KLPAEKQVEAIAAKLKELNPSFDGKVTSDIQLGKLHAVGFHTEHVTDISPLRGVPELKGLILRGLAAPGRSKLRDLGPLQGMNLEWITAYGNAIEELTPLRGMPLKQLHCMDTPIRDLTPLAGMPLADLNIRGTAVTDLKPLQACPLKSIQADLRLDRDVDKLRSIKTLEKINNKP